MGIIEDFFKALDRIPIWDRLQKVPAEVDALAKRIYNFRRTTRGQMAR